MCCSCCVLIDCRLLASKIEVGWNFPLGQLTDLGMIYSVERELAFEKIVAANVMQYIRIPPHPN